MDIRWNAARCFAHGKGWDEAMACEFADWALARPGDTAVLFAAWVREVS